MKVELISQTIPVADKVKDLLPEDLIVYIARVSNPTNQELMENNSKLINYCIKNKHWSIFEHFFLTFEIETSLNISTQILRHGSAKFQQFSGRYQDISVLDSFYEEQEYRLVDVKNRQNSYAIDYSTLNIDQLNILNEFSMRDKELEDLSIQLYKDKLEFGISKETSRSHLLQAQKTKLYMSNNLRNILHYLEVRLDKSTQKEHRMVAEEINKILIPIFPNIFNSLKSISKNE